MHGIHWFPKRLKKGEWHASSEGKDAMKAYKKYRKTDGKLSYPDAVLAESALIGLRAQHATGELAKKKQR